MVVVTIQRSESTGCLIATGVGEKPPTNFKVLESIGHQETSSGSGLMGWGEKILSSRNNSCDSA